MLKKLKLSFDGGDSGSKKCKRGYDGAYGEVWRSLPLVGVWRSVLCWCVWQESGLSRREDVSHLIYFIKTCYNFCTFNAICKDNAAINCITVQHKKVSFSSTLTMLVR
jgi:hypothetical protein